MKKIMLSLLFVVCLFALMFELTGNDPNNNWSFRTYVSYVTDNIEPFPKAVLKIETASFYEFWDWFTSLISYPFECIFIALKNCCVLLYGLLPFEVPGLEDFDFGNFQGGDGFGGGGGGAR